MIVQSDQHRSELKYTADPSYALSMVAEMSEKKTGEI